MAEIRIKRVGDNILSSGLSATSRPDYRLEVAQVAVQLGPATLGERILGSRRSSHERLVAGNITRVFQPLCVGTEVSIGKSQGIPEIYESDSVMPCECTHDTEPNSLVNQRIQVDSSR